MKAIRPRETRLFMDEARALFAKNPSVLKVVSREPDGSMTVRPYKIENFDIEFANNFFYYNDITTQSQLRILMVPFALNGDE